MARKKRKGYDLRDFWPWYERNASIVRRPSQPPPFTLGDLDEGDTPMPGRIILQIITILSGLLLLTLIVWGIFFA